MESVNIQADYLDIPLCIDDYKVHMPNPSMVIIFNRVTSKRIMFRIDFNTSIKYKIYQIARQLMMINNTNKPKYKAIFKNLSEAQAFIEKLKYKVSVLDF